MPNYLKTNLVSLLLSLSAMVIQLQKQTRIFNAHAPPLGGETFSYIDDLFGKVPIYRDLTHPFSPYYRVTASYMTRWSPLNLKQIIIEKIKEQTAYEYFFN